MLLPVPPLPLPCCNFAADSRVGFIPADVEDGAADAAAVAALLEVPVDTDDVATLVALLRRPKNPELFFLLPLLPLLLVDDEELLPEVSTTDPSPPPPSPSPDFLRPEPNIFLLDILLASSNGWAS
jgi:hypothetical protein